MAVVLTYRIDGSDAYVSGWSDIADGAIVIPPDDGATHPVVGIDDSAFAVFGPPDAFTSLDMSGATNLVTIGANAFYGQQNITGSLSFPSNLQTIGDNAFGVCVGLTGSIVIPDSVDYIGEGVFSGCTGLNGTLTLGTNVTTIGVGAFASCQFTGSLTIPSNVSTLGYDAFVGCNFNGTLTINSSLFSEIGDGTFQDCSFTGSLILPSSITRIGWLAFGSFGTGNAFSDATIPSSVTTIGDHAFENCTSLTSITFEGAQPTLEGPDVFKNVTATGYYTYPPTPYDNPFGGLTMVNLNPYTILTYSDLGSTQAAVTGYSEIGNGQIIVPDTVPEGYPLYGYTVVAIGNDAFNGAAGIVSVDFSAASNLTIIGDRAFQNCNNLTGTINIPGSVSSVGEFSFATLINVDTLVLNEGLVTINQYAFNTTNFSNDIVIPDSVTSIGYAAFASCPSFNSMTLGSGVTFIDNYAFAYSTNYTSIDFSAATSLTSLPYGICQGAASLINVTFQSGLVAIGGYAFDLCSSLTSLTLNEGLLEIGEYSIAQSGVTSIIIPNSVTTIRNSAFGLCSNLTSVTLGTSLTAIEQYVFEGCNLSSITIPSSVASIGDSAFIDNTNLLTVNFDCPQPTVGIDVFANTALGITGYYYNPPNPYPATFAGIPMVNLAPPPVEPSQKFIFTNITLDGLTIEV